MSTLTTSPKTTDLPARTFEFARRAVILCRELDQTPGVSRTLATQLLRSVTSIGANAVHPERSEGSSTRGQASQSRPDFTAKYSIACKEARETHYWLRLERLCKIIYNQWPETS